MFIIVLLLGAGVRLWLILTPGLGHASDLNINAGWTRAMAAYGLGGLYDNVKFCDYAPCALLVFWAAGQIGTLFDPALADDQLLYALLKAPACLADVIIALLLFFAGKRLFGRDRAVGAAALYFLNPVTIYVSAYWGQVDAIHTAMLVAAVLLLNRHRYGWTGAATALALLQKPQAFALLPLIVFDAYRRARWKALRSMLIGGVILSAVVSVPFVYSGILPETLRHSYLGTVGRYREVSKNAFNLWYLVGSPGAPDTDVPPFLARVIAGERDRFSVDASWMTTLTWRTISLAMYAAVVAVLLSLYSLRPGVLAQLRTAGLLYLAFFLIPTEMHERYAFSALAFLALWAPSRPGAERLFVLVSAMLLLNLAAVLPPGNVAPQIAATIVFAFVLLAVWSYFVPRVPAYRFKSQDKPQASARADAAGPSVEKPARIGQADETDSVPESASPVTDATAEPDLPPSLVIQWFRRGTLVACSILILAGAWLAAAVIRTPPVTSEVDAVHLSELEPQMVSQGWGELARNTTVAGGTLRLGSTYYVRGLGTHAPSRIIYQIPPGYDDFEATVGIDHEAEGGGSVTVAVDVDGRSVYTSPRMTGASDPIPIRIPLDGAQQLTLHVDPTSDGDNRDHVDWAAARFVKREGN